jgi:hypothetical protein
VVELASMIADEEFSDRPSCVCPVIGAFLRGWNDRAPHGQRQRLAPYAARIVGSRRDRHVTRKRRDICLEWAGADLAQGGARRRWSIAGMRFRIGLYCGVAGAIRLSEGAGDYASRVARTQGDTEGVFELLNALLAVGEHTPGNRPPVAVNGNGHGRPNGDRPPVASATVPSANGNGSTSNGAGADPDPPVHRDEPAELAKLD